jgi:hypothetical protein
VAADTIAILSAAIIIMLGLILNMVWSGMAAKNSRITKVEVKPNHSHSLRDAIDRIEDKQNSMRGKIETIDQRLSTVESLTLAQLTRNQPQNFSEGTSNG